MKTFNRVEALNRAYGYMELDIEPTSALKQAASDLGLPYGDEMEAFVTWALEQF